MDVKKSDKYQGQMKIYLIWPVYVLILLCVMDAALFINNMISGLIGLGFTLVYAVTFLILVFRKKAKLTQSLIEFAAQYAQVQRNLLEEFSIPYGLLDEKGRIIWLNSKFKDLLKRENVYRKQISSVFPVLEENLFEAEEDQNFNRYVNFQDREFRVEFNKLSLEGLMEDNSILNVDEVPSLYAMYMFDETEINSCLQQLHDEQIVVGLLYIDNYDEAMDSIEELRRPLLQGLIERSISQYIAKGNGIVKKLEKDKYLLVLRYKLLEEMRADKFTILENVKETKIGNEISVTISIGLATGYDNFVKNYEMARASIDLALGRGGDQVVIKDADKTTYFGGKTTSVEKNTRVKARVKAHALRELIETHDNIIIMGHKISDVDALGSAIGVYRAAKWMNKHVNIVINEVTTSLRPIMELFQNTPEYEEDLFVNNDNVMNYVTGRTLLVIVDVNKASYTECPQLIDVCKTVVVIDHHRQSSETVDSAVLSYIEPYASSASEMVAEILQYIGDNVKLKSAEANALYAGIVIDTNNFTNKAGVRTFEAAAFIRRNGADIVKVRKLLRNDMSEYKARAEAVRHMEVYKDCYAFAACPGDGLTSPTIVGAQAANEMLNVTGIKASFVFTEFNGEIHISARSIDEINVQVIMEKLGGGGHMSIAGAQLKDVDIEGAITIVKDTIDTMIEEGEI